MAEFVITGQDGSRYKVTADTEQDALQAFKYMEFEQSAPAPPAGMVMDNTTGQMVDTKAHAQRQSQGVSGRLGDMAGTFVSGALGVGSYLDEAAGKVAEMQGRDPNVIQGIARERLKNFEQNNPKTSLGLKMAGGLTSAAPLAATLPAAAVPASMAGRVGLGAATGLVGGSGEGALYGYGEGESEAERVRNMKSGAVVGGATGLGMGVIAPFAGAGLRGISRRLADRKTAKAAQEQSGLSKGLTRTLLPALEADGAFNGAGAANIRRAGPDAMLADAGPSTRTLLDTAIQKVGPAASQARNAVENRANLASQRFNKAADNVLGPVRGLKGAQRDISRASAGARSVAFEAAKSFPIDYASQAGRDIEATLKRIPKRTLKRAIKEANETMQIEGVTNRQIMADIADDGSVSFFEMPNVEQLHHIKMALQEIAAGEVDTFGKTTGKGLRYNSLAGKLRDNLKEATKSGNTSLYGEAMRLGGDKIGQEQALRMGSKLLSPETSMEDVADAAANFTPEQRAAAATGVRSQLGNKLANVKRTLTDPNVEARKGATGIKELSSEANREKLGSILGPDRSGQLFDEIDRSATAFDLRAGVADNSRTFARQNADRYVTSKNSAPIRNAVVHPVQAAQSVVKSFLGISDDAQLRLQERDWVEIANALTEAQGGQVREALTRLDQIARANPKNAIVARNVAAKINRQLTLGGYLTGTQAGPAMQQRQ